MRVAEQYRDDRGSPVRMFEDEPQTQPLAQVVPSPSFAKRPVVPVLRRAARKGRRTWGRLSLLTFFGEAKKVSCRRATPGHPALAVLLAITLTACGTTTKKPDSYKPPPPTTTKSPGSYYLDDGPGDTPLPNLDAIPDAIPKPEPLHRGANRPYTVLGKTYVPNVSNEPFRQQGVASWYGRKYHGQMTSIGDTYDMYAMTAAHPTLPLPSYVRVTNPANMKSVVLRVNDRGPFLSERIIDLSYVAAAKLDIARKGSGMVIVERIFPGDKTLSAKPVPAAAPTQAAQLAPPSAVTALPAAATSITPLASQAVAAAQAPTPAITTSTIIPEANELFLQLAAFSSMENAEIFRARMTRELEWNREPIQVVQKDNLYRVRMGPYKSREEAEAIAAQVRQSHDFSPVIQKP